MKYVIAVAVVLLVFAVLLVVWGLCLAARRGDELMAQARERGWR